MVDSFGTLAVHARSVAFLPVSLKSTTSTVDPWRRTRKSVTEAISFGVGVDVWGFGAAAARVLRRAVMVSVKSILMVVLK